MYLYFDKLGVLKTIIPHGEIPRQGSTLNLYVCFDEDFFETEEEQNKHNVNIDLILPNNEIGTKNMLPKDGWPKLKMFMPVSSSEVTYDFVPGVEYLTYLFSFAPEEATALAGKAIANISIVEITEKEDGKLEDDTVYFGRAEIFVEKTFGNAKLTVNEASLHYKNLTKQINAVGNRLAVLESGDFDSMSANEIEVGGATIIDSNGVSTNKVEVGTTNKINENGFYANEITIGNNEEVLINENGIATFKPVNASEVKTNLIVDSNGGYIVSSSNGVMTFGSSECETRIDSNGRLLIETEDGYKQVATLDDLNEYLKPDEQNSNRILFKSGKKYEFFDKETANSIVIDPTKSEIKVIDENRLTLTDNGLIVKDLLNENILFELSINGVKIGNTEISNNLIRTETVNADRFFTGNTELISLDEEQHKIMVGEYDNSRNVELRGYDRPVWNNKDEVKELATLNDIDDIIGDINSILDVLNGEVV